jgi:hypothetical protein
LTLPDEARATRIGEFYAEPRYRSLAELLIDLVVDAPARAIVVGELKNMREER